MQRLERAYNQLTTVVTFTAEAASTGGFNMGIYSGATLLVISTPASEPTLLTFGTRIESNSDSHYVMADGENTPISITVQPGRAYAVPDALFACSWVTALTSAGSVTCQLVVKG